MTTLENCNFDMIFLWSFFVKSEIASDRLSFLRKKGLEFFFFFCWPWMVLKTHKKALYNFTDPWLFKANQMEIREWHDLGGDSNTRKMGVWIRDAVTGKRRLLIREIPVTQLPKQSQQLTKPVESVKQTSKKKSGVKRKLESPKKSPQKSPHTPKKKSKTAGPFSTPQTHYQTSRLSES